jgi:sulfite oxidase
MKPSNQRPRSRGGITRRNVLLGSATALASLLAKPKESGSGLITLSPRPTDLEMPVSGFLDEITPVEHFFVRCHTYIPDVSLSDWRLQIGGLVDRPLSLTLSDLKTFPRFELVSVLECAGNGRSFYSPRVAGAQWSFGAVGNARWSGVRLRDVLQKAGLAPGAAQLLMSGADVPLGKMPEFQRTVPVEKGLHGDTMLAWEMNGKPLTREHGFPLRLVVPGWASDSWVKWIKHIDVLDHEFEGFWMKSAYRHPAKPVAPGDAVDPADMVPVTDLNVKSVIAAPTDWSMPGTVIVEGVAWSNANSVTKVDVSVNNGSTWAPATLPGDSTKYGFRRWAYKWHASEGSYDLIARATNSAGQTQPLQEEWNPNGYLWNVAQSRRITITRSKPPAPAISQPADSVASTGYKTACFGCHDEHMMIQQHLTRAQWDREITKMSGWGAPIRAENRDEVIDYLSSRFKP